MNNFNIFLNKCDDYLNAILVKDLRQIVRGKFLWVTFFAYIGLIVLILYTSLINASSLRNIDGDFISIFMLGLLYFVSGLVVPIHIGVKTSKEVNDATHELLFITTMSPASIINGKYLSGAIIILMLYATLAPFLTLTLLIGGVDFQNLILAIIFTFLMSNLFLFGQLFLGFSSDKKKLGVASVFDKGGIIVGQLLLWFWSCQAGASILEGNWISYHKSSWETWSIVFWVLVGIVTIALFIYSLLISKLQPDSSNKMYFFRRVASVVWLLAMVMSCFDEKFNEVSCMIIMVFLCIASVAAHTEPDTYTNRVISEIPDAAIDKIVKFPFYYGKINAIAWIAIIAVLTALLGRGCFYLFHSSAAYLHSSDFDTMLGVMVVFLLYIHSYGFLSDFIRKIFFKDYSVQTNIAIIAVLVAVGTVLMFMEDLLGPIAGILAFANPFGCLYLRGSDSQNVLLFMFVGSIFLVVTMFLNLSSLKKQFNAYFYKLKNDSSLFNYDIY